MKYLYIVLTGFLLFSCSDSDDSASADSPEQTTQAPGQDDSGGGNGGSNAPEVITGVAVPSSINVIK